MGRLDGRKMLVTGATGGIGRATALRLASEGAHLALADRPGAPLDALAAAIAAAGPRPAILTHEAADLAAAPGVVAAAAEALGGLDTLCNIAGTYARARAHETSDADWTRILTVNLGSVFALIRAAIPHLRGAGGAVISTASLAGIKGHPYAAPYAASKAGIIALTKSLAAEYAAEGIRFNAVCPGGIRSGMSGLPPVPGADPGLAFRRARLKGFDGYGEPQDVAAAFAYLASPDARFVSGATLVVDGAQLLV